MSFEIKLPLFEGPFDLLLFFIERDELDIYDIPISKITSDFLNYLHHLEKLNIEVASEFILVAAQLMRIKSKMLLPRPQVDESGDEVDPREELVKHLLEYKRFKEMVAEFSKMEDQRLLLERRGNLLHEIRDLQKSSALDEELEEIDIYKVLRVYQKVLVRYKQEANTTRHTVVEFPYTIEDKKEQILSNLHYNNRISFLDLLKSEATRVAAVFNFLAILDLIQSQRITVQVGDGFNNFWIVATAS